MWLTREGWQSSGLRGSCEGMAAGRDDVGGRRCRQCAELFAMAAGVFGQGECPHGGIGVVRPVLTPPDGQLVGYFVSCSSAFSGILLFPIRSFNSAVNSYLPSSSSGSKRIMTVESLL